MIPTEEYIRQKFEEYNRRCFSGKLPMLPIRLSNARTFMGQLGYKKVRTLFGRVKKTDFVLRINKKFDLTEDEIVDILLHEMIHYYIALKRINDTSAHGRAFAP